MTPDSERTKPVKLSPLNTWLQASSVITIVVLTWVSSNGWNGMGARMDRQEAATTATIQSLTKLTESVQVLATVCTENQRQLQAILKDAWSGTDMSFFALRLQAANPDMKVPAVERVQPPAMESTPLTSDVK